jgi:hypothetical protein
MTWQVQIEQLKNRLKQNGVAVLECDRMMAAYVSSTRVTEGDLYLTDGHPTAKYATLVAEWVSRYVDDQSASH